MIFRKPELSNMDMISEYLKKYNEYSCENTPVNILLWSEKYSCEMAEEDETLYVRTAFDGGYCYSLPYTNDMENAVKRLENEESSLVIWAAEGRLFDDFLTLFGNDYEIIPDRDSFEYIYNSSDLINLPGKKYHSKRNHISSLSKQYDWKYEPLRKEINADVLECAKKWYNSHKDTADDNMVAEMDKIESVLQNAEKLGLKGGVIRIDGKVAAFSFGTEISKNVFDINVEKALPEYPEAYAVINREFAAHELSGYKYINREDDLGLEGLRKAKLSYKPEKLLGKYVCKKKSI